MKEDSDVEEQENSEETILDINKKKYQFIEDSNLSE
jgi:hypothetical protein